MFNRSSTFVPFNQAYGGLLFSVFATSRSGSAPVLVPAAPEDFVASSDSARFVDFSWTAPVGFDTGDRTNSYKIEIEESEGVWVEFVAGIDAAVTELLDEEIEPGTHNFRILAVNGFGEGETSNESEVLVAIIIDDGTTVGDWDVHTASGTLVTANDRYELTATGSVKLMHIDAEYTGSFVATFEVPTASFTNRNIYFFFLAGNVTEETVAPSDAAWVLLTHNSAAAGEYTGGAFNPVGTFNAYSLTAGDKIRISVSVVDASNWTVTLEVDRGAGYVQWGTPITIADVNANRGGYFGFRINGFTSTSLSIDNINVVPA